MCRVCIWPASPSPAYKHYYLQGSWGKFCSLQPRVRDGQVLGCAPGAHADAVARLQAERREGAKARKALVAEVAAAHGAALAARAAASSGAAAYHRRDSPHVGRLC